MPVDSVYLFYGVVFIGALLLAEGAYYLYIDAFGGRRAANRRSKCKATILRRRSRC